MWCVLSIDGIKWACSYQGDLHRHARTERNIANWAQTANCLLEPIWHSSTLWGWRFTRRTISWSLDWPGRSNSLAPTFLWHYTLRHFSVGFVNDSACKQGSRPWVEITWRNASCNAPKVIEWSWIQNINCAFKPRNVCINNG